MVRAGEGGWGGGDNPAGTDTSKLFSMARASTTRILMGSAALVARSAETASNHDARGLLVLFRPNTTRVGLEGEVA
jgi:hypothetical protein